MVLSLIMSMSHNAKSETASGGVQSICAVRCEENYFIILKLCAQ